MSTRGDGNRAMDTAPHARTTQQRDVLPLFSRAAAADSFAGYERQLGRLEAEAGVRQQP